MKNRGRLKLYTVFIDITNPMPGVVTYKIHQQSSDLQKNEQLTPQQLHNLLSSLSFPGYLPEAEPNKGPKPIPDYVAEIVKVRDRLKYMPEIKVSDADIALAIACVLVLGSLALAPEFSPAIAAAAEAILESLPV